MPRQTGKIRLDGRFADRKPLAPRHAWLPGGWWLWCLLGLAVGLGAWIGSRYYLRAQLSQQLASASSEQAALQSIDALLRLDGNAAVEVSRSLAHPEFMVANAAFRALNQQLDAWNRLDDGDRLRRMAQVMSELERTPSDLDQDHRILVSGLASRIYALTLNNRESGAADLLSRCKQIMVRGQRTMPLAATGSPTASLTGSADVQALSGSASNDILPDSPVPPPLPPLGASDPPTSVPFNTLDREKNSAASSLRSPSAGFAKLSDGSAGEEDDVDSMPRLKSRSVEHVALSSGRATVQLTALPATISTPKAGEQSADRDTHNAADHMVHLPGDRNASTASGQGHLSDAGELDPADSLSIDRHSIDSSRTDSKDALGDSAVEGESADTGTLAGIDELPIDQLVKLLSSLRPRVAQAAALALRRRGMTDDKLDLAMKLANGSSAERQELLGEMVQRKDLDPRPWLLWMAADGDARVREQAVGLLSPLRDNDVRRQLRLLLSTERDERVAHTIRRVLVQ